MQKFLLNKKCSPKLTTLLFCLCLAPLTLLAQSRLEALVLDSDSLKPVPFVNIGLKSKPIGTVSSPQGYFTLDLEDTEGSLVFSSIGYSPLEVLVKDILGLDTIRLDPIDRELPEVKVIAKRLQSEEKMLGVKNKTRGLSVMYVSQQLGAEIGTPLRVKKPFYVKTANFVFNHAKGDSLLFRVNLYTYSKAKPGEKILKENVFLRAKAIKGLHTVDLSEYNLFLTDDVFLSLEWLNDLDGNRNTKLTVDTKKGKNLPGVYYRKASNWPVERMDYINPALKPCFYLFGLESEE